MNKKIMIAVALFVFTAVFVLVVAGSKTIDTAVRNGTVDLSSEGKGGLISLDGEWEFYWDRHLGEQDFRSGSGRVQPDMLAHVPESWNNYRIGGSLLGESGYATYRITVKVEEMDQRLSLRILPLSAAYRLYIDGKLLVTRGKAGTEADGFLPDMKPATAEFTAPGKQFDMIVQLSNFETATGGMNRSIFLGTPEQIAALSDRAVYKDLFLLGSLVIAVFYSLCMFFMNRDEKISLYFACVCLIFIGRIVITGSYFIYVCIPQATIHTLTYINYFTSHAGVLVFALMIREFFPGQFSDRIKATFIVMTAGIIAFITAVPMDVYSSLVIPSDVLCLIVLGYAYYVTAKAVIGSMPFSILAFSANGICLMLVIIDFYFAATDHSGQVTEFSTLGFFTFIFLYAFILARKFSISFLEVKILSRRLMELDKLKDEFLANTSHELRTPLHGIISLTESLLDGVEGPLNAGQSKNLILVASSGRKLAQLIHDILDMSKLKNGDIVLNRKLVFAAPLIESILHVFKRMYPHKDIVWSYDIPPSLPPIHADENRLVQMLYNLIGNAAKFTENGEISVTAEQKDTMIEISVTDTGKGITPDKLEVIFIAFEQADSSITRQYGGVGLGLSITKRLVELHGGRIGVDSAPGSGSRFTIGLPAAEEHVLEHSSGAPAFPYEEGFGSPAGNSDEVGQLKHGNGSGESILVVDDDVTSLQSAVNLLILEGYSVTAVTNGKAALACIGDGGDYQLVILDVMMPEISGYDVCRHIRLSKSVAELPILMATAKHQPEDIVLGFDSGANDFLIKPFEPVEFKARVKTLIEWKRSMDRAFKSEIAFLQAQIKPHFIYNTLNTISYFCTRDGAKAKELLSYFADYLRSHFDFKSMDKLILLEKELRIVTTYLEIEKERFGDRLQVTIDADTEARAAWVPPFLIQPLVENAVIHGVLKKIEGGVVYISAKREGEELRVTVSDTGAGMSEERIANVLSDTADAGVGLSNTRERLKKLYGRDVTINSTDGKGTEIVFAIPAKVTG
jgi:two-component system sensor histidine kinase ChiS